MEPTIITNFHLMRVKHNKSVHLNINPNQRTCRQEPYQKSTSTQNQKPISGSNPKPNPTNQNLQKNLHKFTKMSNPSTKSKSNHSFKSKTNPNKSKPPKKKNLLKFTKMSNPSTSNSLHYQNSGSLWKISITSLYCKQVESVTGPSSEGHLGSFPLFWFTISSTCVQLQLSSLCFQWVTRRVWRLEMSRSRLGRDRGGTCVLWLQLWRMNQHGKF